MGRSRLVLPDTVRLPISDGDWLLAIRQLNAGEQRRIYENSRSAPDADGKTTYDPLRAGEATVLGYVVDWSFSDADPALSLRDRAEGDRRAAFNAIDHESYVEILRAVEAHVAAIDAERTAEKNGRDGAIGSSAILPSPSAAAGVSSGSAN